jgi:hypothetical protein
MKMLTRLLSSTVFTVCLLWGTQNTVAFAKPPVPVNPPKMGSGPYNVPLRYMWPKVNDAWISAEWSAKDSDITKAVNGIDQQIKKGFPASDLLKRYSSLLQKKPDDTLSRVSWAWVVYRLHTKGRSGTTGSKLLPEMERAAWLMRNTKIGGSREIYRVRFLTEGIVVPSKSLLPAARRLRKAYPDDPEIKHRYALLLANARNDESSIRESTRLLDELIQVKPNMPAYYISQGNTYRWLLEKTHRREDGEKAIRFYEKAGSFSQKPEWQSFIRFSVNQIKKQMK